MQSFSKNIIFQSVLIREQLFLPDLKAAPKLWAQNLFPCDVSLRDLSHRPRQVLDPMTEHISSEALQKLHLYQGASNACHYLFGIFQLASQIYLKVVSGPGNFKIDPLRRAFQVWQSILNLKLISSDLPDCLEPMMEIRGDLLSRSAGYCSICIAIYMSCLMV